MFVPMMARAVGIPLPELFALTIGPATDRLAAKNLSSG